MNPFSKIGITSVILLGFVSLMNAQDRWSAELYGGLAENVALPLSVHQTGQPNLDFIAHYKSNSLKIPPYYGYRFCWWRENRSWELEFTHHKIYLLNNPPEISQFNLSHGLNILTLNRGRAFSGFVFRAGVGPVITHPEFTIRGVSFDQTRGLFHKGYMLNGIALNMGVAHPFQISKYFFINLEAKTTFAYAHVTQDDLKVDAYNWAFHLILGPGYNFLIK